MMIFYKEFERTLTCYIDLKISRYTHQVTACVVQHVPLIVNHGKGREFVAQDDDNIMIINTTLW